MHAFGAGLLFGIGLWLSGMAFPAKVLDFLDVTGAWDPSLLLVMAGAVGVTLVGFRPFKNRLNIQQTKIDPPLVVGAALFGLGWGVAGYCPGPGLTALANLSAEAFVFVGAMIAGGISSNLFAKILASKDPGA